MFDEEKTKLYKWMLSKGYLLKQNHLRDETPDTKIKVDLKQAHQKELESKKEIELD